jgi:hypothetical protein
MGGNTQMMVKTGFVLSTAMFLGFAGVSAHAQTAPSGQMLSPGVQTRGAASAPCGVDSSGMPLSTNDATCGQVAPPVVAPSTNNATDAPKPVMAVVRVETHVDKPATLPFPMDFTNIGTATMVRAKMPRLEACFRAGKVLSDRSGAGTSTTCVDHKGDVIAYEECKPKVGDTPMVCSTVMANDKQGSTVASAKP